MTTLLLRLEGPLQAWSAQGKLRTRDTEREPTKSGVLGLVGAAIGMDRSDDHTLELLCSLRMAVRVDRPGTLLRDYHTAGSGRFRGRDDYLVHGVGFCVPTERFYLQDASFVVGLEGERALLQRVVDGFASPVYPLFLGRRSCPLSVPPVISLSELALLAAMRSAPRRTHDTERTSNESDTTPLRIVIETREPNQGDPRYDVPLSFGPYERRYGRRYVSTEWTHPTTPSVSMEVHP